MISVEGISKAYGSNVVLHEVGFSAPPGHVTGFLGANGAGKSTTLRAVVGLVRPDSGRATILGRPYRDLVGPARHVGVLLDTSALHPGRTGTATLAAAARYLRLPRKRVDEVCELVGLPDEAHSKQVRTYSLGMRQRLGLAYALLGDPEVLILDEPANGLDPSGIRWMREFLASFARSGRTVLLSSHLLSEVEKVADRAVIIAAGRIVADGSVPDLLGDSATRVRTDDDACLRGAAEAAGIGVNTNESGELTLLATPESVGDLCRENRLAVRLMVAVPGNSLEDLVVPKSPGKPNSALLRKERDHVLHT